VPLKLLSGADHEETKMPLKWKSGTSVEFAAGGRLLEGRMWGPSPARATTIILLHEGLGSIELWRNFPEKLAEATGLGVFAYSREGYGNSDPVDLPRPIDYMERHAIDVLPQVIDAIAPKKVILVGHSDGASIAALYLGNFQDQRVRGVVLMAPHFFTEEAGLRAIAQAKVDYENGDLRAKLAKYHKDVDNAFRGWNDAWTNPDFAKWDISEVIDYFRVPALAIQGRDDQYGSLRQIEVIDERTYSPFEAVIIDNCKHSPFAEKPAETLAAIQDFVARLERIDKKKVRVA
jgi:pimeloyl-ACP methyl ester carboxylesterase